MALYPDDMTKEEVMEEFARIIEPTIRKLYYEKMKKEEEQKEKEEIKVKDDKIKNP